MCSKQILTQNIHINIDINIADGLHPVPFSGWVRLYVHMWTKCVHPAAVLILRHSCTSEFWRPQPSSSCWYRSTHTPSQMGCTRSHSQIPMLSPLVTPRVSHTPAHPPWSQATSLAHQLVSLIFSGAQTLTCTPTLAPVTAPGTQGPYAWLSDPRCCTHSPVPARAHRTESPSPGQRVLPQNRVMEEFHRETG